MKTFTYVAVLCFLFMFMTAVSAEESATGQTAEETIQPTLQTDENPETQKGLEERETEDETDENIDPELKDRMDIYNALQYKGAKELPTELMYNIRTALSDTAMPIDIIIEGKYLKTSSDALKIGNEVYVPLKSVAAAYSFTDITFDQELYKVILMMGDIPVEFLLNKAQVVVNDTRMDVEAETVVVNGITMVPIHVFADLIGLNVGWDPVYYTLVLHHDTLVVNESVLEDRFYSYDELQTFSKLVMKEAGSVSYETKHGVASVVMNQLNYDGLEDTIEGVIYDESGSEHFPPAHANDFEETVPNTESVLAVKKALRGENSAGACLYFNTRPFKGKTIYKEVDGVYFCY